MNNHRMFWMIFGGGPSTVQHWTEDGAMREAERLANENPNVTFFLLEAKAAVRKNSVTWSDCVDDIDLPF